MNPNIGPAVKSGVRIQLKGPHGMKDKLDEGLRNCLLQSGDLQLFQKPCKAGEHLSCHVRLSPTLSGGRIAQVSAHPSGESWRYQSEADRQKVASNTFEMLPLLCCSFYSLPVGNKRWDEKYFGNVWVSNFPFIRVFVRFCCEHFFWLLRYLKENQNQTNGTINTQNKDVISSALNDWTFSLAATLFRQVPPVLWPETAGDRRWHDWWHTVVD